MIKRMLGIFVLSRLIFVFFAFLASYIIPLRGGYLGVQSFPDAPYLFWIWTNFDGRHFTDIVINGYRNFNFAFFPLYPLVIWLVNYPFSFNLLYVGMFVSITCFIFSMIMLYKIVELDYAKTTHIPWTSVLLLSFFPLSFFYNSIYSDSLFLFLSISSFYFARKRNWLLAGIFGGLTTATRIAGIALLPALLVEWFLQNGNIIKDWKNAIIVLWNKYFTTFFLTLMGFLAYLVYLQVNFGNFLLFQEAMVAWRQNEFVFPPQVVFRYLKIFSHADLSQLVYWISFLEFTSMVFYFSLAYYVGRKIRWSYAVLMFFVLLLPTFTGTFAGMPRYILHAFPSFMGLSLLFYKSNNFVKFGMVIAFLVLGFVLTGLFTRGYFIA